MRSSGDGSRHRFALAAAALGLGLLLAPTLRAGAGEAAAAGPSSAAEVEAAEAAVYARVEALLAPSAAAAIAGRLAAPLATVRQQAYLALYGEADPEHFYATKDFVAAGYQENAAAAVFQATDAVLALFLEGPAHDPEVGPRLVAAQQELAALAGKRKALGLPATPNRLAELVEAGCERVAQALAPARDRAPLEANARTLDATPEITPLERSVLEHINLYRVALGRPALRVDPALCRACREHSEEMARLRYFAHESPTAGRREPGDRARLAGYTRGRVAENIFSTAKADDAAMPIAGWHSSPGHHKNMLASHEAFGVGRGTDEAPPAPPAATAPPASGKPSAGGGKGRGKGGKGGKGGGKATRYWTALFGEEGASTKPGGAGGAGGGTRPAGGPPTIPGGPAGGLLDQVTHGGGLGPTPKPVATPPAATPKPTPPPKKPRKKP